METEKAARLALGLQKNALLPELLTERRTEITEAWEGEQDAAKRELLWQQLKATIDFGDYLYARIGELSKREPVE